MDTHNPKIQMTDCLEKRIDQLIYVMGKMDEKEREEYDPHLKFLSKEYYQITGKYYKSMENLK